MLENLKNLKNYPYQYSMLLEYLEFDFNIVFL